MFGEADGGLMNAETIIVVVFLGLAMMATSFWYARRVDRQHAQSADLLARSAALQDREAELLARWEAVVGRLEQVIDRLERRS
jgi:hypothetical protein